MTKVKESNNYKSEAGQETVQPPEISGQPRTALPLELPLHFLAPLVALLLLLSANSGRAQDEFWQSTNGPYGGIVFASAIDSSGVIWLGAGTGVFASTDNGISWSYKGLASVSCIVVKASGVILAGSVNSGIFRSRNNGVDWTPVDSGLGPRSIQSLAANVKGQVFAGTYFGGIYRTDNDGDQWFRIDSSLNSGVTPSLIVSTQGDIIAGTGAGILRSTDDGDSWTSVFSETYIYGLHQDSGGTIYAGGGRGVYKSTDQGGSWIQVNVGLVDTFVISVASSKNGHVFAGSHHSGISRSVDSGSSWVQSNLGLPYAEVKSIMALPTGEVLIGTAGGGVYRSSDDGVHWIGSNEGLLNNSIYSLLAGTSGKVYAGSYFGGLYETTDRGIHWKEKLVYPKRVGALAMDSSGSIYAGALGLGVFRSTDEGVNWQQVSNGLGNLYVISLAVDSGNSILAGTGAGLYTSKTSGNSWILRDSLPVNNSVLCLAVGQHGIILAGTNGNGIFRSTDRGINWTQVGASLFSVNSLHITPDGTAFAGCEGIYGGGIYRSTDDGVTWTQIALARITVRTITNDRNGDLYVGTNYHGVFMSKDNGASWTQTNSGLATTSVTSLAIDWSGYIFAGGDQGVYRSVGSTILSVDQGNLGIHPSYQLSQSYPNPFNPAATIQYSLPAESWVTLKIYNPLGQEVATLVDRKEGPGTHSAVFNAVGLSSGVYFYRLKVGSLLATRKLVLVK